jgi:hypothetical protein
MAKDKIQLAHSLLNNLEKLKTRRYNYDDVNQDITDYVLPNRGNFNVEKMEGDQLDKIIFDSTAITAAQNLSAILSNGLTDPSMKWARLKPKNPLLRENDAVMKWLEEAENSLFDTFNSSETGFALENHQLYLDLIGYGTAIMYVGEELGQPLFQTKHLSEIWLEENSKGFIDTVYRQFEFTARQAVQEWGEDEVGTEVKNMYNTEPHKKMKFLHIVMPKKDYLKMNGSIERELERFEYISIHVSEKDKHIMSVKGFHEMPYIAVRWVKRVGEVYGISPSWNALSDILTINAFAEIDLKASQKQVDPPILMSDDGVIAPLQTFPGGVMVGGLNDEGKEMVKPFITGQNNQKMNETLLRLEEKIEKAYFVDQFQERQGVQPLTATESTHKQQNKMLLLAPQTRRIEDEYLALLIERVMAIKARNNQLPPNVPEELMEGGELVFNIEYTGPLAFMQQSNQLLAYNRFFANLGTFVEINPKVMDNFDFDKIVRDGAVKAGVPRKELKDEEAVAAQREAEAQARAIEQQKADIAAGAETAATLSKAGLPITE